MNDFLYYAFLAVCIPVCGGLLLWMSYLFAKIWAYGAARGRDLYRQRKQEKKRNGT